jgi:hypothetical protein
VPTVTTLTLSSPSKATLFRIILWRCWETSEHEIAHLGTYDLQSGDMRLVRFHCVLTEVALDVRDVADIRYLSHAETNEDNANQIVAQSPNDDSNATTSPAFGFGNGTASAADRLGPDSLASARR